MSELIKNIFKIKKSKPYIDYNKYHCGNIFGITKMSRRELMHSNFIAWALDSKSSHALGFYPIYQLIRALYIIQDSPDNRDARKINKSLIYRFFDDSFITGVRVEREFNVPIGKTTKYIDILIEISTGDKILPVIIENKVESKENGSNNDQTVVYFDWCENQKYTDKTKFFDPVYIYLYPQYNSSMQKSKEYIRMTYQDLVDYILEPSMGKCGDLISINNYKAYLQCLSFQTDNDKGEYTMAISSEERKILNDFIKENKDLLCSVLDGLKDEVDPSVLSAITSTVKDYSTYQLDGSNYGKARLVLAAVKKYVKESSPADFAALQGVFKPGLQGGSKGVVRLLSDIPDKDKGIGGQKRYFVDSADIIALPSGEEAAVCSQWGAANIDNFIDYVNLNLKYGITKV